ncbi:hypothetical protein R1flu_027950 [Riccia fluitans]|uniref:Uncharacterized protein n=1 Tax=Riccia fluitans TaxID=41844 RepID=A0ABD1XKB2_9MARC
MLLERRPGDRPEHFRSGQKEAGKLRESSRRRSSVDRRLRRGAADVKRRREEGRKEVERTGSRKRRTWRVEREEDETPRHATQSAIEGAQRNFLRPRSVLASGIISPFSLVGLLRIRRKERARDICSIASEVVIVEVSLRGAQGERGELARSRRKQAGRMSGDRS